MISHSWRRDCGSKPGRRLVEEQQIRIADQRAGHGQPLLLAARQLAHQRLGFFFQRDACDHVGRLKTFAIETAEQGQRLQDGELFREPRFLQRDADPLADFIIGLAPSQPQYFDVAGSRGQQALEDFDGRRLAGSVGSQQSEAFAALDVQIEPAHGVDRRPPFVALDEIRAADSQWHGRA